jgi:hypothetical protein
VTFAEVCPSMRCNAKTFTPADTTSEHRYDAAPDRCAVTRRGQSRRRNPPWRNKIQSVRNSPPTAIDRPHAGHLLCSLDCLRDVDLESQRG